MSVLSLKTILEQAVRDFVLATAGSGSTSPDPDLPTSEQLLNVKAGYLLFPQDFGRGPLARVKLSSWKGQTPELGGGSDHFNGINSGVLEFAAVTGRYTDPEVAAEVCGRLEEILRLAMSVPGVIDNVISNYTTDNRTYAAQILLGDVTFGLERVKQNTGRPVIATAVPTAGNTSTAGVGSGTTSVFSGQEPSTYVVQIVTPNTAPGALAGMTWKWKENDGAFSAALPPVTGLNPLSKEVGIIFGILPGQSYVAGDSWTIKATPTSEMWAGVYYTSWQLTSFQSS
jgi:hypothetical protein